MSPLITDPKRAYELLHTRLVKLCDMWAPVHAGRADIPGVGRRGSWFLSDNSKRSLWWVFILSLAVSWLAGGCQPPQVPEYDATPDPEAIRVAYVDGNDLAIMRIDGTQTVNLARGLQPTDCAPYYISPDGQWIAYQQADDGLWVVPTDGGTAFMLSDAVAGSVSWFPDSSGVVYTLDNDVYAQWLDLSRPPQPLAVGGRRYLFPTWSPDGKYISFLETTDDPDVFNVILIQSDGTGWRTLGATAPERAARRLCPDVISWSPDSTRFLVDFGKPAFAFYVSGGSPVQLGAGSAPSNHRWSPDGRSLTYQDEFQRLWLVKANGSDHKLLTEFPVSEAVWAPEDRLVAYIAQHEAETTLETIDVETGETQFLTGQDQYIESNPRWAPDGQSLIFARSILQEGSASGPERVSAGIWHVRIDGASPPAPLTQTGDAIQVFAIR